MKQNVTEFNQLSGNAKIQNFNIELNATVFDMLVDKIYSDKVLAVIREWSTNAVDACIDARLPIRFDAHLPTIIEPYFSVRDYGTGLCEEDLLGLYSTLGASTKRESNNFNGTFGLGRGAGLAYSTRFQVDSYYNGQKISYLVSTDNGVPAMIALGKQTTSEPNGLNVQVNVNNTDLQEFTKKALDVYQFFDTKPTTNLKMDYPSKEMILKGPDWYIEETKYGTRYNNTSLVIMGNVAYELSRTAFDDHYDLLSSSLRLIVPLGSVSIPPGRESLSLDKKTIEYITSRLIQIKTDANKQLVSTLSIYTTAWEKMIAYNKKISVLPRSLRASLNWSPEDIKHVVFSSSYYGNNPVLTANNLTDDIKFMVYSHNSANGYSVADHSDIRISDEIRFIIADETTGFINATKLYRDTLTSAAITILIKPAQSRKSELSSFLVRAKRIIKELGNPTYKLTSEYSTKVTKPSSTKVTTATDFYPLTPRMYSNTLSFSRSYTSISGFSSNITKFYYFELSGYVLNNLTEEEAKSYLHFFKLYRQQNEGTYDFKIIGVPKGAMKNISKDPRFIPIKEAIKVLNPKVQIADNTEITVLLEWLGLRTFRFFDKYLADKQNTSELSTTIKTLVAFDNKYSDKYKKGSISSKHIDLAVVKPKTTMAVATIKERYPLLPSILGRYSYTADVTKDLMRYIKLEDSYLKTKGTT